VCGVFCDVHVTYGDSTQLIYLRARYYNPAEGRFFAKDPSGAESNLYLYSRANPINRSDPSGLFSKEIIEKNMSLMDFADRTGDNKNHSHWAFYALLRNAKDFDSINVGHIDLARLHPDVSWDFMSAEIWSVNCETLIIGGQRLSEYYRTHILQQRDPLIWWRDTTPMYYNLETEGRMNSSERGNFKFTDGADNNQTAYPVLHSISVGIGIGEGQIAADIDGNKYFIPSGGAGKIYGLGYTESYLCNNFGRTCSLPSPSEIEYAIAGICTGGEVVIIGGINLAPLCLGIAWNGAARNLGISQVATFYIGLEAGAGSGASLAFPLSVIGVAPNPSLGWRWAIDNQRNGITYDKVLAAGW
jgi:hypothetical protein